MWIYTEILTRKVELWLFSHISLVKKGSSFSFKKSPDTYCVLKTKLIRLLWSYRTLIFPWFSYKSDHSSAVILLEPGIYSRQTSWWGNCQEKIANLSFDFLWFKLWGHRNWTEQIGCCWCFFFHHLQWAKNGNLGPVHVKVNQQI